MAMAKTYDQTGRVQDLSPIVELLNKAETPFLSMLGTQKATNTLFSWTEEKLATPGDNALPEGGVAGSDNVIPLTEYSNYTQIFTKTAVLSGSYQKSKTAGERQAMEKEMIKKAKELKQDIEWTYVNSAQVGSAGDGTAANPRRTAGYHAQAGISKDLEGKQVDADTLDDILLSILEEGGKPDVVMAHPRLITSLAKRLDAIRMRDMSDSTKFTSKVTKYLSNAGEVEFHPNLLCKFDRATNTGDVLLFDSSKWHEKVLQPYESITLAKTGDSDSRFLRVEKGLVCTAPKSAAIITNAGA